MEAIKPTIVKPSVSLSHKDNDPKSIAEFLSAHTGRSDLANQVQDVKRSELTAKREKFRLIEDDILEQSMTVVKDAAFFREIDPGQTKPPQHWIDELGYEEAIKRLRVANAAWLGRKEAPYGLAMAQATMTAIVKARTTEKTNDRPLNMQVMMVKNDITLNTVEVAD